MPALSRPLLLYTPLRFSPPARHFVDGDLFDRAVAARIEGSGRHVGFSGQTYHTFRALPKVAKDLVSPTPHVERLRSRYQEARKFYPIEQTWLGDATFRRSIAEYGMADRIQVASEYSRRSFVEAGVLPGVISAS